VPRRSYDLARTGEEYFEVHEGDEEEPLLLRDRFDALPNEKSVAPDACETMCRELRGALDSLYDDGVAPWLPDGPDQVPSGEDRGLQPSVSRAFKRRTNIFWSSLERERNFIPRRTRSSFDLPP
jgi:hypothetical protein